jgi:hypothetical protein
MQEGLFLKCDGHKFTDKEQDMKILKSIVHLPKIRFKKVNEMRNVLADTYIYCR